jgi:hypothetical protein
MKTKSYAQVTEQMTRIMYATWEAEELENEEYVFLSWEDWAYCLTQLDYYPKCVACSEDGYVIVADSFNLRLAGFNKEFN